MGTGGHVRVWGSVFNTLLTGYFEPERASEAGNFSVVTGHQGVKTAIIGNFTHKVNIFMVGKIQAITIWNEIQSLTLHICVKRVMKIVSLLETTQLSPLVSCPIFENLLKGGRKVCG